MDVTSLVLERSSLRSQITRALVGERLIDTYAQLTTKDDFDDDGGLIGTGFSIAKKVVGFLVSVASTAIGWFFKNLWDIIVQASYEIRNFDWTQTDANIKTEIGNTLVEVAGALGDVLGAGTVWLASVGLAGALSIKYPVLGATVALRLAEEGGDEIRSKVVNLLTVTRQAVVKSIILTSFLTLRQLRLFGLEPVGEQKKAWTIASAIEEKVEAIPFPIIKSLLSRFLESADEAIIEAGYVVSYTVDDYYTAAKTAQKTSMGTEKVVEIVPDTRVPDETLVLRGQQKLLMPAMQTSLMTHRLVKNRDVGQMVGQPIEEFLKAKTKLRALTIVFRSREKPPYFNADYSKCKTVSYDIPDVRVGLNWAEIKLAAKHFTWGKFRCTANLDNGRQMAVYGASATEAERKLRELKTLTTADIITLSVTEEKDRNLKLKKEPIEMYPAYATLLVRRSTATDPTHVALNGTGYSEERQRINLYFDAEPPEFEILR